MYVWTQIIIKHIFSLNIIYIIDIEHFKVYRQTFLRQLGNVNLSSSFLFVYEFYEIFHITIRSSNTVSSSIPRIHVCSWLMKESDPKSFSTLFPNRCVHEIMLGYSAVHTSDQTVGTTYIYIREFCHLHWRSISNSSSCPLSRTDPYSSEDISILLL